jgi:hypothetical protein
MPKTPSCWPEEAGLCDKRLPEESLRIRREHKPEPLTSARYLNGFNVSVWLYKDAAGRLDFKGFLNTTIGELNRRFGPAATPDAEVGFHSEMHGGQWFKEHLNLKPLQVFSERIPCPYMCAHMLRKDFPGVPWFYYYNRRTWEQGGKFLKSPADILTSVYGL